MPQILAIDYGLKRSGLAITDELQIIASGLGGIETSNLLTYIEEYTKKNSIEKFVIGLPLDMFGKISDIEVYIQKFIQNLNHLFPEIPIERMDERFTSKIASQSIHMAGKSKKAKKNKNLIDEVSAVIILQSYLEKRKS